MFDCPHHVNRLDLRWRVLAVIMTEGLEQPLTLQLILLFGGHVVGIIWNNNRRD